MKMNRLNARVSFCTDFYFRPYFYFVWEHSYSVLVLGKFILVLLFADESPIIFVFVLLQEDNTTGQK